MLLVGWPGSTAIRLAAEAELRRLAWRVVDGPAAAGLLVVAGSPESVDTAWLDALRRPMPAPRVVVTLRRPADTRDELAAAAALLAGGGEELESTEERGAASEAHPSTATPHHGHEPEGNQAHEAHDSPDGHDAPESRAGHRDGHAEEQDHGIRSGHAEQDTGSHGGHDMGSHSGHDMGGHAGHDMGETTVAGLPMAERADDRDGLRLDLLHVPLGPALNDWPYGLILRVSLQGDVMQDADVEYVRMQSDRYPFWSEPWLRAAHGDQVTRDCAARRRCGAHLDSLGRLLAVVGWGDFAARARRLRDDVLAGVPAERLRPELLRLARRVARSRTLRWLVAGLGPLPADRAHELGVSGPALTADGDAYDRMRVWLEEISRALDAFDDKRHLETDDVKGPRGSVGGTRPPSRALLDALPELLLGAEFAAARVIVASLDPDIDELVAVPAHEVAHG
ncbi:hypothetical protein [Streptomyces werraensis]|uniref:hypothetical protein n=1 Tax=Streptomyces werraensis TaxID=68284 RepID=UPI0033B62019